MANGDFVRLVPRSEESVVNYEPEPRGFWFWFRSLWGTTLLAGEAAKMAVAVRDAWKGPSDTPVQAALKTPEGRVGAGVLATFAGAFIWCLVLWFLWRFIDQSLGAVAFIATCIAGWLAQGTGRVIAAQNLKAETRAKTDKTEAEEKAKKAKKKEKKWAGRRAKAEAHCRPN